MHAVRSEPDAALDEAALHKGSFVQHDNAKLLLSGQPYDGVMNDNQACR
jgi:hypothetical protein